MTDPDTVEVLLVQHGELKVELAREDLDSALADRDEELLRHLLADDAEGIDVDSVAVLPDGTVIDVFRAVVRERPSLRGGHIAAAVTAVIAAARPAPDCGPCTAAVCPRHIAEALLTACRQERIFILAEEDVARLSHRFPHLTDPNRSPTSVSTAER